MEEFINEVKNMSTSELMIIIEDQEELYSEEEFEIIKKELDSRKDNKLNSKSELINEIMEEALEEETEKEIQEEKEKKAREYREKLQKIKEERDAKIALMKAQGFDEYCEYKVLKFSDSYGGSLDSLNLEITLNNYAMEGWRVKTSYTNELGKNSNMTGFGGVTSGFNSTNDEHIIILERVVKIKGE